MKAAGKSEFAVRACTALKDVQNCKCRRPSLIQGFGLFLYSFALIGIQEQKLLGHIKGVQKFDGKKVFLKSVKWIPWIKSACTRGLNKCTQWQWQPGELSKMEHLGVCRSGHPDMDDSFSGLSTPSPLSPAMHTAIAADWDCPGKVCPKMGVS